MELQLRIQAMRRDPQANRELESQALVDVLRTAVSRQGAAPVAVIMRDTQTQLVPLAPLAERGVPMGRFLSALSRSTVDAGPTPDAIGLMGTFRVRRSPTDTAPGVPLVQLFLEWPDCAWWHWRALLDADGAILEDTVTERAATLGDALPARLGRWWSTGRRMRLSMELRRSVPTSPLVH